ncbi:MAG TPA: MOSC domain-containing protein [Thermoanaerobaculia bacterium]|nr:MOSC domain-containing protein [Thermoanaerobaculia bacterium]
MGEVVAIWLKRFKGGPMDRVMFAEAVAGRGLAGNANLGGKRQVTIIDEARWKEATDELGIDVDPSARRANVMLRGIDLEMQRGRMLRIGRCVVRIYNETRPCEQMDDAQQGLRQALKPRWRAGAYGEVVEGGVIQLGDTAEWVS